MSDQTPNEIFAVELAQLAREIAMDIFPIKDIIALHRLTEDEWERIQRNTKFQAMVADMAVEWNSAKNTRERVKIKAATGLESVLETYIREISDEKIPLSQRVEAGKFLARIGELEGSAVIGGGGGSGFRINININGQRTQRDEAVPVVIEGELVDLEDDE